MVTKNLLRLQMFNVLHENVLSSETIEYLKKNLSEDELGALVSMFMDNSDTWNSDLKSQRKFDDRNWLIDIAQKYNQVLMSLDVSFITQGSYVVLLDDVLLYLKFRLENSDVSTREVFDAVYEYVRILRCRCDVQEIPVLDSENKLLSKIVENSEPELNLLVMSLLCCFSFDDKNIPLVQEFLNNKKHLILYYLKIFNVVGKIILFKKKRS